MQILVVDDNPTSLTLISHYLEKINAIDVTCFSQPLAAIQAAQNRVFDIVLVDFQMPDIDGISVIRHLRRIEHLRAVPIIMITGDTERSTRVLALEAGATDFLSKPIEPVEFRARVSNLMALRRAQIELENQVHDRELEMVQRLAMAIETRDSGTGGHIHRMAEIVRLLAVELGLDAETVAEFRIGAPLHDIGKIGLPDAILNKPGALTPDERRLMESHVTIGEAILRGATSKPLRFASNMAATHHERWDGKGYPRGLVGDQIPICGRIAAIADVFDALVSPRPYKAAWPIEKAMDWVIRESGNAFDPACVDAFRRQWRNIEALYFADMPEEGLELPAPLARGVAA